MKLAKNVKRIVVAIAVMTMCAGCVPRTVVVREAPPALRVERQPARPGPTYVWQSGQWNYRRGHYTWVSGKWVRPPRNRSHWVAGHWEKHRGGWIWTRGYWR